jgi:hypothetical protein
MARMKCTPELYNYNVLGELEPLDYTKCLVQTTWIAADARNPAEIRKSNLLRIGLEFKAGLKVPMKGYKNIRPLAF